MRLARMVAGAGLAAAALSISPAAAWAGDIDRGVELTPSSTRAGGSVWVATRACGDDASATGATNASPGQSVSFRLGPAADTPALQGEFTVPSGTGAGTYDVDIVCASGQKASARLTVTASGGSTVQRGVRAGVGGSSDSGVKPSYLAGGAVLIGGAGALAWARVRRPD